MTLSDLKASNTISLPDQLLGIPSQRVSLSFLRWLSKESRLVNHKSLRMSDLSKEIHSESYQLSYVFIQDLLLSICNTASSFLWSWSKIWGKQKRYSRLWWGKASRNFGHIRYICNLFHYPSLQSINCPKDWVQACMAKPQNCLPSRGKMTFCDSWLWKMQRSIPGEYRIICTSEQAMV